MSKPRNNSKRSNGRPAQKAHGQQRQAPKATVTPTTISVEAHKKRTASQTAQLITPAAKTPPKTATPKATSRTSTKGSTPTPRAATTTTTTTAGAAKRREALAPVETILEATVEVPIVPEMPAADDAPVTPPIESVESVESVEAPEPIDGIDSVGASVAIEQSDPLQPLAANETVAAGEPDEPAQVVADAPDGPAYDGAQASQPADYVPVVPVATERRMPTLAVMAQLRREAPSTSQPSANGTSTTLERAADSSDAAATPEPAAAADAVKVADVAENAAIKPAARLAPTVSSVRPRRQRLRSRNAAPSATTATSTPSENSGSAAVDPERAVTRPVTARYSNRKRPPVGRTPDFVWESDPRLSYLPWPLRHRHAPHPAPLPPTNWLVPVVVVEVFLMALMGLSGALFEINNNSTLATWALVAAGVLGLGGFLAYIFSEMDRLRRFAPLVLTLSQLGLLVWAMLVVGPRASLLALAPALVEVALLMSGTMLACTLLFGSLLIYALFAGLAVSIGMTPIVALDPTAATVLDVLCVVVGLLAGLWLLLTIQAGRERAQAIARARRHEADVLRNLVSQFRQETQDNTGKLESALFEALKGHGINAIPMEGTYRLLAETIMDTASRLEVLQRDREERLRLEGALRVAIRAVERKWLGVKPEWPGHTGTSVDELVALLRTPSLGLMYQDEENSRSITPRLIPIPTLAIERDTPPPAPVSHPLGTSPWLAPRRRARRPDLYPLPSVEESTGRGPDDEDGEDGENPPLWNGLDFQPPQDEP